MQAQEDIVSDTVNLLPNSSFSQDITGYIPNQDVALTIQNGYLHATSFQTSSTPGVRFPRIYLDACIYTFKIKLSRINITSYSFPVFIGDLSGVVDTATIETVEGWSDYTVKYAIPVSGEYIIIAMWSASPDYVTGIDIQNSFLCKGEVNIQNYSLAPYDLISQAAETSAKELGFTKIEQGLIQSSHIKLMQPGGSETAGISGIDKDANNKYLPAFWAGGNYASAISNTSNVVIKHSGAGKLGRMYLDEAGATTYKDNSGVDRLINTPENISTLQQLQGSSQPEIGGNIQSYSKSILYSTFTEEKNLSSVIVTKNNADFFVKNIRINAQLSTHNLPGAGVAQITIMLIGTSGARIWLGEAYVDAGKESGSEDSQSETKLINTSLKVVEGTYNLIAKVYLVSTSDLIDASVSVYGGSISWQYIANIKRTEVGSNGMMTFSDINNFFYAAVENGKLKAVLKSQDAPDMPGVLAAYSVNSAGYITKRWGGKTSPNSANRISTGTFDIPHLIGHTDYIVTANVVSTTGTNIAMIGQKYNNSVRVVIRNLVNDLENMDFDVIITGRNA